MSGYNCKIEYTAGTENTCADLLSRKPYGECTDPILEPFELDINENTFEVGTESPMKWTQKNLQVVRFLKKNH